MLGAFHRPRVGQTPIHQGLRKRQESSISRGKYVNIATPVMRV